MVWVKFCGMTNPGDALAAADAGADAIGMLFAPSKRRVTAGQAEEITRALPPSLEKVGVFYNESAANIEDIATRAGLTAVQLHADESPDFARQLFRNNPRRHRSQMKVFKTLHVAEGVEAVAADFIQHGGVDGLLFDTIVKNAETGEVARGGTGQTFDWSRLATLLPALQTNARIIVAGGLSAANVAAAIQVLQPWGVDVCSGVERHAGTKDGDKMRQFIAAAKRS